MSTIHRVGSAQWLILGALAQSPDCRLTRDQLAGHFNWHRFPIQLTQALRVLEMAGRITWNPVYEYWTLTEYGADSRRQRGRSDSAFYLPLREVRVSETSAVG